MAKVWYVKDGPRPSKISDADTSVFGGEISLTDLEKRIQDIEIKYLGVTPPEFNRGTPSPYPRRVVVEIEANESKGQRFTKNGFYILLQLTPENAESILFPK